MPRSIDEPVTITLPVDQWFAILCRLAGKEMSPHGVETAKRATESLVEQFKKWSEQNGPVKA